MVSPADWTSYQAANKAALTASSGHRVTRESKVMAYFAAKTKAGSKGTAFYDLHAAYLAAKTKSNAADAASGAAKSAVVAAQKAKVDAAKVHNAAVKLQTARGAHYAGITKTTTDKADADKTAHAALVTAATSARDSAKDAAVKAATASTNAATAAALALKEMDNAKTALAKA